MKKILLCCVFAIITLALAAHEFWLLPGKFLYRKGDTLHLKFLVGEDFNGENWSGNNSKVSSLRLYNGGEPVSLASLVSEQKGDSLSLALEKEGTQMICFNSTNSFISLPAAGFNQYLGEDHLDETLDYRQKNGENDSAGHEFYQRSVKTIFQVGNVYTTTCSQETSLPLDLVPLQNPYRLADDDSLSVKVLFKGKPLAGQVMVVWHRNREIYLRVRYKTDGKGIVRFPVMPKSRWMISTVKMVRLGKNAGADWQSYWGSLTWGYN